MVGLLVIFKTGRLLNIYFFIDVAIDTSRETGCTPGSQPPSVLVLEPGARIEDERAPPLVPVSCPGLKVHF